MTTLDAHGVSAPAAPPRADRAHAASSTTKDVVELSHARLAYGRRVLWDELNLSVRAGEYLAVLGSNGTGKTSLLRVLLGLTPLTGGSVRVLGRAPAAAAREVGYIPQQRGFPARTPLRARDLVTQGIDGHRWGLRIARRSVRRRVDEALAHVGALEYADAPVGVLSGGEQQRLRVAQALINDPALVLCDEAMLSLDLRHQRVVAELVARQRRERGSAVVFVTHDVNPIIGDVDRILYLANGSFRIGTPADVLRSDVLSELYQAPIDVVESHGRIVVTGRPEHSHHVSSQEGMIP